MSGIDEQTLIDLVEGELEAGEAKRLRTQLRAQDPAMADRIEAMVRDKALLRELPHVTAPVDFLAELEPVIARPMLMDEVSPAVHGRAIGEISTRPGAARRALHRRHRQVQIMQAAIAAGVLIAVSAGLFAALNGLGAFDRHEVTNLATNDHVGQRNEINVAAPASAGDAAGKALSAAETDALENGELHHKLPSAAVMEQLPAPKLASAGSADDVSSTAALGANSGNATAPLVLAEFELVVTTRNTGAAEQALAAAIVPDAGQCALVRNLTVAELGRIETAWLATQAPRGANNDPARASVDHKPAPVNRRSSTSAMSRAPINDAMLRDVAEELSNARLVAGNELLMPGYDTQIVLSDAGAALTIAVPIDELSALLQRLTNRAAGHETYMLTMRRDASQTGDAAAAQNPAGDSLSSWARQYGAVRQALDAMQREHPDAVVLLPVVIAPGGSK